MPDSIDRSADLRGDDRKHVLQTGTIHTREGLREVRVRDVSHSGMRILSGSLLEADTDVIFAKGDVFAAARVVWSNQHEAGLKFYRPFQQDPLGCQR